MTSLPDTWVARASRPLGWWAAAALLCAAAVVVSAGSARAHMGMWTSHGLQGASVYALAIDPMMPGTLYAGTQYGGVFKSTDGGRTWDPAETGLPDAACTALVIDPDTPGTLYAGMGLCGGMGGCMGYGIFTSTDGGGSWAAVNTGLPDDALAVALAIDPNAPGMLYAGTDGTEVFAAEQVAAACAGDCKGEGQVTIDDVLTMVNAALGNVPASACSMGDADHDGQITVNESIMAVQHALDGCG